MLPREVELVLEIEWSHGLGTLLYENLPGSEWEWEEQWTGRSGDGWKGGTELADERVRI